MLTTRPSIIELPRRFPSRYEVPVIGSVSSDIFQLTYFTHCLQCDFCHDQCCSHGVDVDLRALANIQQHAPELEQLTGVPRTKWFEKRIEWDATSPGGGSVRTRVKNGSCVFLNPKGRGCLIHSYALDRGLDYHDLKSMVDCLFPLTFEAETLTPALEVEDGTLACLKTGPTIYRGARPEIAYYFGEECVKALDEIERGVTR